MVLKPVQTLRNLRSTRDLRAELLNIAVSLADTKASTIVRVEAPAISDGTIREEWGRMRLAIKPAIAKRMQLELAPVSRTGPRKDAASAIALERPNYRAEVLRLLIGASLANDGLWSVKNLIQQVGASQTPVRQALSVMKRAGIVQNWSDGYVDLLPESISAEQLAKLQAMPQTLRFRFERGAHIRTPAELLERALPLLGSNARDAWENMALSGTAVAQAEEPALDLIGTPRLDLVAYVSRHVQTFNASALRKLSDGLEHEPNVLAPAPVVVTLVRAEETGVRKGIMETVRCAPPMDVFLSLIDLNLRRQAAQYVKAVRS